MSWLDVVVVGIFMLVPTGMIIKSQFDIARIDRQAREDWRAYMRSQHGDER